MKFLFSLVLLILSTAALADAFGDRLAGFAAQKASQVSFVETWTADYLDEPLVSKGKLFYKAPGQFKKIIEHPDVVVQSIEGNQLSVTRNGETRSMLLTDEPVFAASIYALRYVLEGNKRNLQELFELIYNEHKKDWNLKLIPKDKTVAKKIESITFQGYDNHILQIQIQYHDGNSLLTEIFHD